MPEDRAFEELVYTVWWDWDAYLGHPSSTVPEQDDRFDPANITEKHPYVRTDWYGHKWDQPIRLFYA